MAFVTDEQIDQIIKDAREAIIAPDINTGPAASGATSGACIVVRPGKPDRCQQLTPGECNFVKIKVKEIDPNATANWFPGPCPI